MANSYFQQIALAKANDLSKPIVDAVTQASPVLATMPVSPSTHGLWDVAPKIDSITGASFVEFASALSTMSVNAKLDRMDLKIIGGEVFCPEDLAIQHGGVDKYLALYMPAWLRKSAQTLEADILTNSFRAYAIANGNIVKAGTSSSGFSSIIAVTYTDGQIEGIYDENSWNSGNVFNIQYLNNGSLTKNPSTSVNGYYQQIKSNFGVRLYNANKVAAYVNINASQLPTASGMDQLLELAEAGTGIKTVLYMHPRVYTYLKNLKNTIMTDGTDNDDVFKGFSMFDRIPIVTTYNLPKLTETIVS